MFPPVACCLLVFLKYLVFIDNSTIALPEASSCLIFGSDIVPTFCVALTSLLGS